MYRKKLIGILRVCAAFLLVLLAALVMSYYLSNPEPRRLDANARAHAPGSFVPLDDGVVHYELTGATGARTVVLIHGAGPNSSAVMTPLAAVLARENLVLTFDLYGQGYSDRPLAIYGPDLFDRQLQQLLLKLGITDQVDLVGFSLGSWIATAYAARHPERVKSVTLIGPAGVEDRPSFSLKLATYPLIGEYLFRVFERQIVQRGLFKTPHAPKYVEHCLRDEMPLTEFEGTRRAALSVLRNIPLGRSNVFQVVGHQRFPVLAIYGEYDNVSLASGIGHLKQLIPRVKVAEINNASHGALVYDNAEEVGRVIINFLSNSSQLSSARSIGGPHG